MKFNSKSLIVFTLLIGYILTNKVHSDCENPCIACQRTVYQMKFQQIADCGKNHTCKSTCYKVKELWTNSPDNIFKPFVNDVFGKCEICFRAGFCNIAECKAQQEKELEVIDQIVNRATLTVRKHPLLNNQQFPQFKVDTLFYEPEKLLEIERKIDAKREVINNELDVALLHKSAAGPISTVNDVMKNYFPEGGAFSGKSVAGENVTIKAVEKEKAKVEKFVDASNKYVDHIKKIIDLKQHSKEQKPEDQAKVKKLADSAKKDLDKKIKESKVLLKTSKKQNKPLVKDVVQASLNELNHLKKAISH